MKAFALAVVAALGLAGAVEAASVQGNSIGGSLLLSYDGVSAVLRDNTYAVYFDDRVVAQAGLAPSIYWVDEASVGGDFGADAAGRYRASTERYDLSVYFLTYYDSALWPKYFPLSGDLSAGNYPFSVQFGYLELTDKFSGDSLFVDLTAAGDVLTYAPVPLPAAAPMLFAGAASLIMLRRRARSRRQEPA